MPKSAPAISDAGLIHGWRSGLEEANTTRLDGLSVRYTYEPFWIHFVQPEKKRKYKPDIVLLDNGIICETKGIFPTSDRQKHLWIKDQHPDLEIRFVFSRSATRISKKSKTTYGRWAEDHGFQYADKLIPQTWIDERPNTKSLAAIVKLLKGET